MKIALVNDAIYPYVMGGVEKRLHELACRLHRRGHDVHLYGLQWWDGEAILRSDGVTIHGVGKGRPLYVRGRRSIPEAFTFSIDLLPRLLREEFDLIDCQAAPYIPCFSSKTASIIRRKPFIITWHEVWNHYWYEYLGRLGYPGRMIERMAARLTSDNVAVSNSTQAGLSALGIYADVMVIPNGIDLERIRQISPAQVQSDVVYAGRLIKQKNVDVLIRAIGLIQVERPDIRCLIIGDGPEAPRLHTLVRELNLERQVIFTGSVEHHDDLIELLKSSRVFVLPSTREGFGIVVLEANAAGLPVVTVDLPMNAARDLINGSNGITCALSEVSIASGIRKMLDRTEVSRDACIAFASQYD